MASSTRSRTGTRAAGARAAGLRASPHSPLPHPLGRGLVTAPATRRRPVQAPFAALFGGLVAAEDLYLAWLVRDLGAGRPWLLGLPVLLAGWALAGAVLVVRGRGRGAAVLATAAVLPLLGMLGLGVFFALLGGGTALWSVVLLLVGPVGCLALSLRRPVREWSRPAGSARRRNGRLPGGR